MALPPSLLTLVERHGCFTGTYSSQYTVHVALNPTLPPVPMLYVSCEDCLGFKVGALQSVLPPGTTVYALADQLTAHMRKLRNYRMSIGGYHTAGGGFWLGAAYYDCGVFLLDGSRNPGSANDLDLLVQAFRHRLMPLPDPRMTDPKLYSTTTVYLDFSTPPPPIQSKQDLLQMPQCSLGPKSGHRRATLAEFLPLSRAQHAGPPTLPSLPTIPVGPGPSAPSMAPPAPRPRVPPPPTPRPQAQPQPTALRPTRLGELCPQCGAEIRERELFSSTFVGCLC